MPPIVYKTMLEQNKNNAKRIFDFLQGIWVFDRTIAGHGRMAGRAVFLQQAPLLLHYTETGAHELQSGKTFDFHQAYRYLYKDGCLLAEFSDGRPFHSLEFKSDTDDLKATALHLCVNDTYAGEYIFYGSDHFSLRWDVQGPHKDYVIQTNYFRQAS